MRRAALIAVYCAIVSAVYGAAAPPKTSSTAKAPAPAPSTNPAPGGNTGGYPTPVCPPGVVLKPYAPIPAGQYPTMDCVPYVQDPMVQSWLKAVDFAQVPTFPQSVEDNCPTTGEAPGQCFWSCSKCVTPKDINACPQKRTWGVSYDDGPGQNTGQLLDFLKSKNIKATFFVVGSRVSDPTRQAFLKRAYAEGHHIGIHTWSHHALTSLTNEQIVAELKWTEKAIKDVIGVSPIYFRPPLGAVDNRVRAISEQLGYKNVLWTTNAQFDFDTNDWRLVATGADHMDLPKITETFNKWFAPGGQIDAIPNGFIVLEHDVFPEEVQEALNVMLPVALQNNINMMSIADCMGDTAPYRELAANTTKPAASSAVSSGTASAAVPTGTGAPGVNAPSGNVNVQNANGTATNGSSSAVSSAQISAVGITALTAVLSYLGFF